MNEIRKWRVPARVNLIGDHTDYSGGLALPIAIDRAITVKARLRADERTHVWSMGQTADFDHLGSERPSGWLAYIAGVAWALNVAGFTPPALDIVIESDIPVGAGLSSSAALCCGIALAMASFAGHKLSMRDIALIAAKAENEYVGAPTGLLDQFSACFAEAGHALLLDFSAPEPSVTPVAANWAAAGLTLAVIDTATRHNHATGGYRNRREEVEAAATTLGISQLAKVSLDQIVSLSDPILKSRTQHVFTENTRVRGAVKALREERWELVGSMLTASHTSLCEDFQVSSPELDLAVESALTRGALGARMTGGGFGGCAIALIEPEKVDELRSMLEAQFTAREWPSPHVFVTQPQHGAQELT